MHSFSYFGIKAPWTSKGFKKGVEGFAYWFCTMPPAGLAGAAAGAAQSRRPKVYMGSQMIAAADARSAAAEAKGEPPVSAVMVHHFAHRYAKAKGAKETAKDRLTWHCGCAIEWSDGRCITVVELAWWSGLGGYVTSDDSSL